MEDERRAEDEEVIDSVAGGNFHLSLSTLYRSHTRSRFSAKDHGPSKQSIMPNDELLTPDQIATYLRDGVLVVNNLLSPNELRDAHVGLANTLMEEYDVNVHDLEGTGINLVNASSTNGAGE